MALVAAETLIAPRHVTVTVYTLPYWLKSKRRPLAKRLRHYVTNVINYAGDVHVIGRHYRCIRTITPRIRHRHYATPAIILAMVSRSVTIAHMMH